MDMQAKILAIVSQICEKRENNFESWINQVMPTLMSL